MSWEGNIVPHAWYQHLRTEQNTPHTTAIIILSDIIYWYRPVEIRDETTGRTVGQRRKFAGDMLQASYQKYVDLFGFTKGQVRSAFDFLRARKLVHTVLRSFTSETGVYISNAMYVEPIPDAIHQINETPLAETVTTNIGEDAYAAIPTSGMPVTPGGVGDNGGVGMAEEDTYTETSWEVSQEVSQEVSHPPSAKPTPPTGPRQTPPRGVPKPTRGKLTKEQQEVQTRLMHVFMSASDIQSLPARFSTRNESWFKPLQDIAGMCDWNEDSAADLIRETVKDMNKRGLDMKCPASIVNIAMGIKRRGKDKVEDGAWRDL